MGAKSKKQTPKNTYYIYSHNDLIGEKMIKSYSLVPELDLPICKEIKPNDFISFNLELTFKAFNLEEAKVKFDSYLRLKNKNKN